MVLAAVARDGACLTAGAAAAIAGALAGGAAGAAAAAGVGALTCKSLMTVLTPVTFAASAAAARRSGSLVLVPVRVITPLLACTLILRLPTPASLHSLPRTSLAI